MPDGNLPNPRARSTHCKARIAEGFHPTQISYTSVQ
ncbi:hypothetical protein CVS37_00450 [Burkholderia lata]|nr:hypothetical protein CVS37_00450 [Burkholderia lata]